jgi:hypothetical protein
MIRQWLRRRETRRVRRVLTVLLLHDLLGGQPPVSGWPLGRATRDGASVYIALAALEREGLVCADWETLPPGVDRPRRRFYRLTEAGRAEARLAAINWLKGEP